MANKVFCKNVGFWKKLKKFALNQRPQDWFKWFVLIICLVIVYYQLLECCMKMRDPPITSYSKLIINDSMNYPALTVCREPPYNKKVFPKFNFSTDHVNSYPSDSIWKYFPYDIYNVSDFWEEAVYKENVFCGFSLNQKGVGISSSIHLNSGMCHTIVPNFTVSEVGKKSGYSLLLKHDLYDYRPLTDDEPGWKIYVHEPREKFSDNIDLMSSRQDPIFVPVGEITEVSIDAYQFSILRNCTDEENYSVTECEENCTINEDIKPYVDCSVPWLPQLQMPLCNEYSQMRTLLRASNLMKYKDCCIKNCKTTYYKIFVVKRTPCPPERKLTSNALIYFSSKTVITMEEKYSYSWNDFLGEVGGTVGFLLGLSILGVIGTLDKIIRFFFCQNEDQESEFDGKNAKIQTKKPTIEIIPSEIPKH